MIKLTPEAGEEETAEEPANQILAANLKKYKIEYEMIDRLEFLNKIKSIVLLITNLFLVCLQFDLGVHIISQKCNLFGLWHVRLCCSKSNGPGALWHLFECY